MLQKKGHISSLYWRIIAHFAIGIKGYQKLTSNIAHGKGVQFVEMGEKAKLQPKKGNKD